MNEHVFQTSDCPRISLTPEEQRRLLAVAEKAETWFANNAAGNGYNSSASDLFIGRQLAELMDGLRAKIEPAVKR